MATSQALEPPDPQDLKAVFDYPAHLGLRTATYKFVEYGNGEREVYDLQRDPDETINLTSRLPRAWLAQLSKIVHDLGHCSGQTCRQLEAVEPPALPEVR